MQDENRSASETSREAFIDGRMSEQKEKQEAWKLAGARMRPLVRLFTYFALPIVASFLLGDRLSKFILGKAASSDWLVFAVAFIIIVIGVVWLIVKRQKITPFRAILCLWCVLTMLAPVYDAVSSSFKWKNILAIIMLLVMLAVILIAIVSVYRFFVTRRK